MQLEGSFFGECDEIVNVRIDVCALTTTTAVVFRAANAEKSRWGSNGRFE